MKIEKLPSGSYRVRKMVEGKTYSLTFDHEPKKNEITLKLAEMLSQEEYVRDSFKVCAEKYIALKEPVHSPATTRGYLSLLKNMSDDFKKKRISDITQADIQLEISNYASATSRRGKKRSSKSVANLHGFISPVMAFYRPNFTIHTTLPQKARIETKTPTNDEVRKVLEMSKGTRYHIPFQLAVLGLRRSEVCALTPEDIKGNVLHIHRAKVLNKKNEWIVKELNKTEAGNRKIIIPDSLAKEIKENGCVYDGYPENIYDALISFQKKLGFEHFTLHSLRHFYTSYCHENGMSDADLLESGGWKSMYTMRQVYRHAQEKHKEDAQKKIIESLNSDIF